MVAAVLAAAAALAALGPAAAGAVTVPPGFDVTTAIGDLTLPTAIRFAPGTNKVLVAEKSGIVKVYDGLDDPSPTVALDLGTEVHDYWDRGLLGLAVDPGFAANGRVYVLYARNVLPTGGAFPRWPDDCPAPPEGGGTEDGCVVTGRIMRFTLGDDDRPTDFGKVLVDNAWCLQFNSHAVDALQFGPDGYLYASSGEGASYNDADWGQLGGSLTGTPTPKNPCGDPPNEGGALRSQDVLTPGDPTWLDGAIIRIDPDTGAPAPGNPAGADDNARRIIANGFRNPFRFTFRPGTEEIWVGDVGWGTWEEVDRIPDATDAVRDNFGWPCREGPEDNGAYSWLGLCQTVASNLPAGNVLRGPFFTYKHLQRVYSGDTCEDGGSSISGVAFAPDAFGSLGGALLFTDYSRGCAWSMTAGANGVPNPYAVGWFMRGGAPVDIETGPDGAVYVVDINGAVYRVESVSGNRRPHAVIVPSTNNGYAPLNVAFDGRGSSDPDGGPVSYAWDLDGDGSYDDSGSAAPSWTYSGSATYTVGLRVRDPQGAEGYASVLIHTDDRAPQASITAPGAGLRWTVGQQIAFAGVASDPDGEPARIRWQITLEHCVRGGGCHSHFVKTLDGATGGVLDAPDHEFPSHLTVKLTATDPDAPDLTTSVTRRLDPRTVRLTVAANVAGLGVKLNGEDATGSITRDVIPGSSNRLYAATPQRLGTSTYVLSSWSNGARAPAQTVRAPTADATYTARFTGPGAGTARAAAKGPRLRLAFARRQRLRRGRATLRATCPAERCTITATGSVRIEGQRSVLRFKTVRRTAKAGRSVILGIALDGRTLARVRRALRRGRKVVLHVRVEAGNAAGGRTRFTRAITLRR